MAVSARGPNRYAVVMFVRTASSARTHNRLFSARARLGREPGSRPRMRRARRPRAHPDVPRIAQRRNMRHRGLTHPRRMPDNASHADRLEICSAPRVVVGPIPILTSVLARINARRRSATRSTRCGRVHQLSYHGRHGAARPLAAASRRRPEVSVLPASARVPACDGRGRRHQQQDLLPAAIARDGNVVRPLVGGGLSSCTVGVRPPGWDQGQRLCPAAAARLVDELADTIASPRRADVESVPCCPSLPRAWLRRCRHSIARGSVFEPGSTRALGTRHR